LLGQPRGTVLFVVPTTSLALDQARAFRDLVYARPDAHSYPRELAYHSELSAEVKVAIRQRVADGSQRMLFTSPEALLSGLSAVAYKAAEQGLVTAIVVDEAHVVAQWGTEFRPDFQALAGVREDLLAVCARHGFDLPPTILLSATLTQDSLETLGGLFARPGPTSVVSAVSLRHEPSYWLTNAVSNEERSQRVVEALRHLPRPAIVYTTRVADAKELHAGLVSEGWRRVAVVAGDTTAVDRRAVIDRLRDQSLDLVVATSAFGLGVDQPDVRTVIHACIPETLDRWYQEVGRGGRDGHPSVALLIATDDDYALARDLSRRKVVTLETGRERWDAMAGRAVALDGGRLRVSLSAAPARLDVDSSRNRAWNVRTLLLLHRAGVVALEAEPPPRRQQDESDEAWSARISQAFTEHDRHAVVRLLQSIEDPAVWENSVAAARATSIAADRKSHDTMRAALVAETKICELLQATYEVARAVPGVSMPLPITVAPSCGGCPGCRARGSAPRWLLPPLATTEIGGAHRVWASQFLRRATSRLPLVVLLNDETTRADLRRAIERLVERGLGVLDLDTDVELEESLAPQLRRATILLEHDWVPWHAPNLPAAIVRRATTVQRHLLEPGGPSRLIFAAGSLRDPRHASATLGDYHGNVTDLAHFMRHI